MGRHLEGVLQLPIDTTEKEELMSEESSNPEPRTAGELRRRLAELGHPWSVDPRLGDDDPLPDYGRGGQPTEELPENFAARAPEEADLAEVLQQHSPSNTFLRARWVELGLLSREEAGEARSSAPPPPDHSVSRDDHQEEER
jgi:hypothetical protein